MFFKELFIFENKKLFTSRFSSYKLKNNENKMDKNIDNIKDKANKNCDLLLMFKTIIKSEWIVSKNKVNMLKKVNKFLKKVIKINSNIRYNKFIIQKNIFVFFFELETNIMR